MKSEIVKEVIENMSEDIKNKSKEMANKLLDSESVFLTESTINYDANSIEDAVYYLNYRSKQLLKFGYTVTKNPYAIIDFESDSKIAVVCEYQNNRDSKKYVAIYLLKDSRGNGFYEYVYNTYFKGYTVVTMLECDIHSFLFFKRIDYVCHEHDNAYTFIQDFYGDSKANRSSVPYIYHIDEGLGYMDDINASDVAKQAYSLHPLLQSDEAFNENKTLNFNGISVEALLLAVEYRRVANSYLSKGSKEDFVGFTNDDIHAMLYADKKQNQKDFLKYHYGTHERSEELKEYFENWMVLLEGYKNGENN